MSLVDTVRRTLQRDNLATPSTRVLAAVSGGPDSVALLHVLRDLDRQHELRLTGMIHLNHQLRDEAERDAQFCASLAASLGLPFVCERTDVRAAAAAQGRSLEDAAHILRHAFFSRTVDHDAGDLVAVGHTRDDQAETLLLRLIRGAGSRGLAGMHPRSGVVIRPMLDAARSDVLQFLSARDITFVHDGSNDDLAIPRNRIRAELLPLLSRHYNPRIAEGLAAHADLARADDEFFRALVDEFCDRYVVPADAHIWTIDKTALTSAPRAVAWRVLHRAMSTAAAGRPIGAADVRRAWSVCTGGPERVDVPGHRVQRDGGRVVLTGRPPGTVGRDAGTTPAQSAFWCTLPIPGEVAVPGTEQVVSAEVAESAEVVGSVDRWTAIVPKHKVADGLAVRNRRAGDRLQPTEVGHRKLQDLLVDRKVPRTERDRVAIVVDTADRIVWVAGLALDRAFRVSDPAQAVVILRLKGVGGSC